MKKTRQLTAFLLVFVVSSGVTLAQAMPPKKRNLPWHQGVPAWKLAVPKADVILKAGDQVYMASNILKTDPFDGLYTIAEDGTVLPRFCKDRVKISGLSEVQASSLLLKHTIKQNVFTAAVKVHVVKAQRFSK